MPGNDVQQPQIAKGVFVPAVIRPAIALAKRQFVSGVEANLVAHVEGRKSALRRVVAVLLHHDAACAANRAGIVERFRKSVNACNETPCVKRCTSAHLQRVVNGIRAGLIVIKASGVREFAERTCVSAGWFPAARGSVRAADPDSCPWCRCRSRSKIQFCENDVSVPSVQICA